MTNPINNPNINTSTNWVPFTTDSIADRISEIAPHRISQLNVRGQYEGNGSISFSNLSQRDQEKILQCLESGPILVRNKKWENLAQVKGHFQQCYKVNLSPLDICDMYRNQFHDFHPYNLKDSTKTVLEVFNEGRAAARKYLNLPVRPLPSQPQSQTQPAQASKPILPPVPKPTERIDTLDKMKKHSLFPTMANSIKARKNGALKEKQEAILKKHNLLVDEAVIDEYEYEKKISNKRPSSSTDLPPSKIAKTTNDEVDANVLLSLSKAEAEEQ